jgi:hypothetical protein
MFEAWRCQGRRAGERKGSGFKYFSRCGNWVWTGRNLLRSIRCARRGMKLARRAFPAVKCPSMSTTEILAQLPRLTPEEREAVRSGLDDIDSAAPLSANGEWIVPSAVLDSSVGLPDNLLPMSPDHTQECPGCRLRG